MAQKNGAKSGSGHGSQRATKLDLFLSLLLVSPNVEQAAAQAHISKRTAARWLSDRNVQARRQEQARQAARAAHLRLQETQLKAVDRLNTLLDAEAETVQISAVRTALDFNQRAVEIAELSEQIEEIQRVLKIDSWSVRHDVQHQSTAPPTRDGEEIN
jgi:hypothetical protein